MSGPSRPYRGGRSLTLLVPHDTVSGPAPPRVSSCPSLVPTGIRGGSPMPRHPAAHHPPFSKLLGKIMAPARRSRAVYSSVHTSPHVGSPRVFPDRLRSTLRQPVGIVEKEGTTKPRLVFYNRHAPIVLCALLSVSSRIARGPTRYHRITNVLAHRRHLGDIRITAFFEINGFFPNEAHRSDPIMRSDRVRLRPRAHCDYSGEKHRSPRSDHNTLGLRSLSPGRFFHRDATPMGSLAGR